MIDNNEIPSAVDPTADYSKMLSPKMPSNMLADVTDTGLSIEPRQEELSISDQAVNEFDNQRQDALNTSFMSVAGTNPDKAAENLRIANQIGVGQDIVSRNEQESKKRNDIMRLQAYDLINKNAVLADLMTDPNFASVAHDDIPQLSGLSTLFKVFAASVPGHGHLFPMEAAAEVYSGFTRGTNTYEYGNIYNEYLRTGNKELALKQKKEVDALSVGLPEAQGFLGSTSEFIGNMVMAQPEAAAYAAAYGVGGLAVGAATGPGALVTGAIGAGAGYMTGMALTAFRVERGAMSLDMLEKGYDEDTVQIVGNIAGSINAALEMTGLKVLSAPARKFATKFITEEILKRTTNEIEKVGLKKLIKETTLEYGKGVFTESATETMQDVVGKLADQVVSLAGTSNLQFNSDGTIQSANPEQSMREFAGQLVDTFIYTAKGAAVLGAFGAGMQIRHNLKQIATAKETTQFLTDLSKNGQAAKLKDRSPKDYANFVAAQAQGTAAETMYVDAEEMTNVLNQSGLTAQQIDNALPGVREQLAQATSGGDIQIPTAQFAANIVGTKLEAPLMEHARLAPDAISAKQAIAQQETMQQNMKDAQVEMAVQEKVNAQFVSEAKEIEKVVNDQLIAAGRPPTEAAFAAKLVQARAVTGAARDGITPAQWVARHPVPKMQSQQQAAQAAQQAPAQVSFEQASRADLGLGEQAAFNEASHRPEVVTWAKEKFGDRTAPDGSSVWQNFTEWFGDSKVVDAEGKPMVVYHGTGTVINEFKEEFTGQGNDQLGTGFYFTTLEKQAKGYETNRLPSADGLEKLGGEDSPNTISAILSIRNPIKLDQNTETTKDFLLTQKQVQQILLSAPNIFDENESPLTNWMDSNGKPYTKAQVISIAKKYDNLLHIQNDFFRNEGTAFRKAVNEATGFDGVEKTFADGTKHYVAWFPTQIKSAIANVGTFGQQDPNILRQEAVPATAMPSVTTANPVSPIGLAIVSANLNGVKSVEESDTFFKKVWKKLLIASGKQMRSKSDESVKEAAKLAVADIQDFVKNNPQFSDYYSQDWMKTRSLLDEYAGRAITDDEFQMYRVICGLTSPNTQLPSNISDTVKLWTHWMENGSFDGFLLGPKPITGASVVFESDEVVSGTTANNKIRTVKIIAQLIKELGSVKAAIDFLREPVTGAELNKVNKSLGYAGNVSHIGNIRALVKMATGQDKLIPRMFIFGQKVGAYTLNAVGDERLTTVDIWESRYIRSFFSGMFENEIGLPIDEKEHDTFVRFGYAFKDEMERVTGRTWTPSSLQALRWFYIIAATRSAGYSKASTNETISTYTSRVLQKQFDYNQSRKLNATKSTTTPPRRIAPQKYERDINSDLDAKGITDPKQRQQITTGSWIQFARSNRISNEVGFQFDTNRSGVPRRSGPLKGLAIVSTHTPGSQLAKAFAKAGASIQPYVELAQTEVGAKAFSDRVRAINANSKFGTAVYVYSDAEYMGKRLFISESGKSGFALSPDGDIVSVFSEAGSREGRGAMALAIQMGGTKLDCFDTVLPGYYAVHGFRAVARVKWSDEYTPAGWDFGAFAQFNGGRPDVVYMVYEANYFDSYSNTPEVKDKDGKVLTKAAVDGVVVADPSEAVAIQTKDIKAEQDRVAANKARYAEVIKPSQTLFQSAVPATFYSALSVEVGKSTTKSAIAEGWKQQIKGLIAKGVVKEKEVYWSGLNNWLDLQEGKITKEQVQAFLNDGGVKVQTEIMGSQISSSEAGEIIKFLLEFGQVLDSETQYALEQWQTPGIPNDLKRQHEALLNEKLEESGDTRQVKDFLLQESETKYEDYQVGGGTNYREVLVTLPSKDSKSYSITDENDKLIGTYPDRESALKAMKEYRDAGGSIYASIDKTEKIDKSNFQSSHWDQSNVLVHLRVNDRVDADGNKVLFVEEVQSDWGQAGRERGFATKEIISRRNAVDESIKRLRLLQEQTPENIKINKDAIEALKKIKNPWFNNWFSAFMDIAEAEDWRTKFDLSSLTKKQIESLAKHREKQVAELQEVKFQQTETANNIFEGVIAAPFVESTSGWLELGLKQILLEAVNGGYSRVAFIDGDQSVQRYRKALTNVVDEVEITRNDDGTYTYSAIKNGTPVQGEQSVKANRINEVFGKSGSKQLLEQADAKPEEIHTIASDDIEIGGEGMRNFYDTIVPQALSKILKKLGGDKIGEVNIGKSVGKKINAKEVADEAVKLIKGDIDVDDFADNLGIEEGDIPNNWINELMDLPARIPKAEARKIATNFAAKVKDKFSGGKSMTQQGFIVTPALAEQVSQGLPLFQAATGGARGSMDPVNNLINLGKNADALTTFHELMHWFVVDLFRTATDPAASELSKSDADILLKWFGIGGSNMQERIANWNAMTLEEQRRHHETTAYNAEIWVATGRAPSVELQGVFERFRRWATRVYKSIRDDLNEIYRQQFGTDLPFLTDEVRGVFDRMLASEEQIARREAIDNFKGMYQTQEESGMNDATWAAYQSEIAEAHEMAVTDLTKATVKQMEWLSGARKGILKTMQAAHNALRRSVQGEESDKMDNEPARKAERFFKTGKMVDPDGKEIEVLVGNKIDSVAVGGMYPTSTTGLAPAVDLAKLRGMTMEGGLAPDLAAEMFGFSSGDELIRALAELKPFKDELKERTDARMLDEHGGMNTEAEKEEAVNKALANEVRARIVAIENRYLTKVKTPVAVIMQGAKELARTILGRMAIKDIKPRNYVAAEARVAKDKHTAAKAMQSPETAGKSAYTRSFNEQIAAGVEESAAASEALVKSVEAIKRAQAKIDAHKKQYGDVDPAIVAMKASHQQVIQGQLAKEGYKILDEVDKALGYVKRIISDANRKKMGADHADQIEAILERFGLMGRYVAPTTRTPLATWAQTQQDIGFDIEIPDIVQESVRKNFLELTPEEFQDVIDTVKQIAHTGKTQQLVLTMDRKVTFEKANTEIVESINANAGGRKAKTRTATTNIGRSIETLTGFFAAHLKAAIVAQIMDGGKDGGPLWNYLIRSANTAGNKETTMRAAATKRISEILDPVFKGGKMGGAGVYFPSVDRSFNRESVLTIALNMGNESNMQRLLDGEGWTLEQVMPIIQSLTAAELNAVQEVWDYSETFKAEIIEKSRRTVGREPNWIEPKPLQVMSADGQMVSLKGGYYPVKYDPRASARSQSLSAADQALRDLKDAHIASTTRRSYTKSRVKEVHDRPLLLNLSGLYSGIGEVIHDLSWHEWLIDSNRLMRSSAFDKAVREQYGVEFKDQITSWIKDVAAGDKGANNAGEMALNYLRQGVSAAGLGFNLMSAVGQITGFAQSVVKVGAKWIGRGIAASAPNPSAAIERVYALSSFMANRGSTQFRELNEIKNMVRGENVAMKRVRAGTYFLMMQMQRMVDIPTWIGAYEKQLSINSDEKLAIAIADQAVIDSQGGGMLKDLSAIERGGPIQKLFTVFYSFMNTNLNLAVLKGMTEKNAGKWVAQQTMLWVVPVVTMYMLKKLLTPQAGDDDDKFDLKEMAKELAAEELSFLMGSFMVVREFADAAKIVTGAKTYGTDYRGPAGLRMIGDTYKFATQAAQLEFDTAFRKAAINIIGSSAGLPAAQINRTIDGIEALMEGETENITAPLFGVKKR